MTHRQHIKEYLSKIDLTGKTVVDWACGTKPVTRYCKGTPNAYLGIDKLDHVEAGYVADISNPVSLNRRYDLAFCIEALEHVPKTWVLLENIRSSLKDEGLAYFSVPFMFPVHSPEDYWRFTDQGLRLILEEAGFKVEEIVPTNGTEGWFVRARKKALS